MNKSIVNNYAESAIHSICLSTSISLFLHRLSPLFITLCSPHSKHPLTLSVSSRLLTYPCRS